MIAIWKNMKTALSLFQEGNRHLKERIHIIAHHADVVTVENVAGTVETIGRTIEETVVMIVAVIITEIIINTILETVERI